MANDKRTERAVPRTDGEMNSLYTSAAYRFAQAKGWRDYLELADIFRDLDTYKDSAAMYAKCIKAASAPAYREVSEQLAAKAEKTAEDYREAARIMNVIQDYSDAREMARTYPVKANALVSAEAVERVSSSDSTTEELGRGVMLLRSIKGYKDTRDLLDRFEKYYFSQCYSEAEALISKAPDRFAYEEAAELFDRISEYSDSAQRAVACRKKAAQLAPKKKNKEKKESSKNESAPVVTERVSSRKPKKETRKKDETTVGFIEIFKQLNKRALVFSIVCLVIVIATAIASIWLSIYSRNNAGSWIQKNINTLRAACLIVTVVAAISGIRIFLLMLTPSMRKKLAKRALELGRKIIAPIAKVLTKALSVIGIELGRKKRLGGRDERSFVFDEEKKEKKKKKKLRNEQKWAEQPDNASRVRFIFIDYMINRIKNGYVMKHNMTVADISKEIAVEMDEKELFEYYNLARYAGSFANEDISNETVGRLRAVNEKRK